MNTFVLHTQGGLCSRLRAVLCAIGFAEHTDRQLIINWPSLEENYVKTNRKFCARFSEIWHHPYREVDRGIRQTRDDLTKPGNIEHRTCHPHTFPLDVIGHPVQYLDRLLPVDEVRDDINSHVSLMPRPCVGVIIRATNNQPDTAPPEWFFARMRRIQRHVEDVTFFLWTDDMKVSHKVHRAFPGRIIEQSKIYLYDRDTIRKQASALYILSRCNWIVGSNHSSFSEMAAWMRGCKRVGDFQLDGCYDDLWNTCSIDKVIDACKNDARNDPSQKSVSPVGSFDPV